MKPRMKRHLIATLAVVITITCQGSVSAQQPAPRAKPADPPKPAHPAKWTKAYVVEWNEPAMHYGGKAGVIDPGTDCPKGTNPEIDWVKVLVDAGYTVEEAKWLRNPANPTRSPVHGQNQMAFRGKGRANVYVNPTSTPDPGLVGVSGTIGEGLNLDGDEKTGFTSPTGERGIDNTFYKTLGCWKTYRGPRRLSSGALQFNDAMRNGAWTTVIVVAGEGADPMNDNQVTVGFYMSKDKMVKDGNGNIAADYTFRIAPHAKYEAIFPARTSNGRIISTAPADVMLRDPSYTMDLELLRARIDLEMKPDGSLTGYVGGYRPWEAVYKGWVNARGTVIEVLTWVQLPAVYYALRRNADFSPPGKPDSSPTGNTDSSRSDKLDSSLTGNADSGRTGNADSSRPVNADSSRTGKPDSSPTGSPSVPSARVLSARPGGEKTHISFALRIDALPAFVMPPDASSEVASVESYKSIAPKETARMPLGALRVVDGIVPDPTGKYKAGPDAVILPPSKDSKDSTNNKQQ